MKRFLVLATMLVALGIGRPAHADLIVDVTGVSGLGETAWAFSGSYSIGDVSQTSGDYSLFGGRNSDDNINNFTHESGELTGGIGLPASFNLQDFPFLFSTAQVSGSQSGVHLLDGISLDSDDPTTGDDFIWFAAGAFQDGETLTFSGTATIAIDINLFLATGEMFRSVSSIAAQTTNNPTDFTMNLRDSSTTAVPEPATLLLLGTGIAAARMRYRRHG